MAMNRRRLKLIVGVCVSSALSVAVLARALSTSALLGGMMSPAAGAVTAGAIIISGRRGRAMQVVGLASYLVVVGAAGACALVTLRKSLGHIDAVSLFLGIHGEGLPSVPGYFLGAVIAALGPRAVPPNTAKDSGVSP
jgi:hypothetical protein